MFTSWKRLPTLGYLSLWCLTGAPGVVQQILEQSVEVIKVIPEEWISKRIVQQNVDVPMSKILVEIVVSVAYRRQVTARVDVHCPVAYRR